MLFEGFQMNDILKESFGFGDSRGKQIKTSFMFNYTQHFLGTHSSSNRVPLPVL
jgi:hypothetical protein